jgi:apolipoprotein D and lipocalin family protein
MNKFLIALLAATAGFFDSSESKLSFGRCPEPTLTPNFDLNQYIGVWYEYARDKSIIFEYGDCSQLYYTKKSNGNLGIQNSQRFAGRIDEVKGEASCKGARCGVKNFPFKDEDYRVLGTDYTTYAVIYSCETYLWFIRNDFIWIATREKNPLEETVTAAKSVMKEKIPYYTSSSHEYPKQGGNCKYLHS